MQTTSYLNGTAQSRSAAFDAAVTNGGSPIAVCDVQRYDPTIAAFRTIRSDIPILPGGTINVDASASTRRTISCSVIDPDGTLTPHLGTDVLAPYGAELVVRCGFDLAAGRELVQVGVFRIEEAVPSTDGVIDLTGKDRSMIVAAAAFEAPYVIAAGTNLATGIQALVDSRMPGLTYNFVVTTQTIPLTVFQEGRETTDPWQNARSLAAAGGLELFFNVYGQPTLRPIPDPTVDPIAWKYIPGSTATVLAAKNKLASADARNVAIVRAEGSGVATPLSSTAVITDPASPLYPGTFGRRPAWLITPLIQTQAQCDAAAAALLLRNAGGSEQLTFSATPNPAHEGGDVVLFQDPDLKLDLFPVLSSFRLPIDLLSPVEYATYSRRAS